MPLRNQPAENHRHSGKYISEVLRNEHLIAKLWRYWYKNKYFNKRYTPPFKYSVVNVLLSAPTHKSLTGYRVFTFKLSRPGVLRLLLLSEVLMPAWDVTTQHPALRSRRAGTIFLKFPRLYKRCDHFAFFMPANYATTRAAAEFHLSTITVQGKDGGNVWNVLRDKKCQMIRSVAWWCQG